ncbi:MAG: ABC transporter substrate-binding protein [Candidatus Velamenicoccus archaeovorus]
MGRRRSIAGFVAVVALTIPCLVSCRATPMRSVPPLSDPAVTVGSFDFPESELLAWMYAGAIRAAGIPVRVIAAAGPREVVEPALRAGLVELLPEYAGTAVQFLSGGGILPSSDATRTHADLLRELSGTGVVVMAPARAQDANALVVTSATARRYGLRRVSDLARVSPGLVFGGPPECLQRPLCLPGYGRTYGLRFRTFVPLDVGGPLTVQALVSNEIDVGLLFTSDPAIADRDLVRLRDDRGLQPAENVTPLIRAETLERFGEPLRRAIDAVSARLTTAVLVALNERLLAGVSPSRAAAEWLSAEGLA